jgi:hypothetical protein
MNIDRLVAPLSVPFLRKTGPLTNGQIVIVKATPIRSNTEKRIEINLACGSKVANDRHRDNVALHFNVRFDTNELVLNSYADGEWNDTEIKFKNDCIAYDQVFEVAPQWMFPFFVASDLDEEFRIFEY